MKLLWFSMVILLLSSMETAENVGPDVVTCPYQKGAVMCCDVGVVASSVSPGKKMAFSKSSNFSSSSS